MKKKKTKKEFTKLRKKLRRRNLNCEKIWINYKLSIILFIHLKVAKEKKDKCKAELAIGELRWESYKLS